MVSSNYFGSVVVIGLHTIIWFQVTDNNSNNYNNNNNKIADVDYVMTETKQSIT